MRESSTSSHLPWQLIGVHSTRMDMRSRDRAQDESLGLNCAWYADVLVALTESRQAAPAGDVHAGRIDGDAA